jgi:hypothetical protein
MAKLAQRLAVVTLLAAGFTVTSANLAFADDKPTPTPGATSLPGFAPKPHGDDDHDYEDEREHHAEIHDKYGNDVDQVFLPPLVVKDAPTAPSGTTGKSNIKPPVSSSNNAVDANGLVAPSSLENAAAVDPAANLPVDPDSLAPTSQTPADKFFQVASFGLGVMALGSVALGGIVVVQRIRQR